MTDKKVILAEPLGFCAGVRRAREIVEKPWHTHGAPVQVRKELVDNQYVVGVLRRRGAAFVDAGADMRAGAVRVVSAYGVTPGRDRAADTTGDRS